MIYNKMQNMYSFTKISGLIELRVEFCMFVCEEIRSIIYIILVQALYYFCFFWAYQIPVYTVYM